MCAFYRISSKRAVGVQTTTDKLSMHVTFNNTPTSRETTLFPHANIKLHFMQMFGDREDRKRKFEYKHQITFYANV